RHLADVGVRRDPSWREGHRDQPFKRLLTPPAATISSRKSGSGVNACCHVVVTLVTRPRSRSTSRASPVLVAAKTPGISSTSSPRLRELRMKYVVALSHSTAPTPHPLIDWHA